MLELGGEPHAAGWVHLQRRHLPQPGTGHDPLPGQDLRADSPLPGAVSDGGADRELSPG